MNAPISIISLAAPNDIASERVAFGQNILGPIFADFALRLWLLLAGFQAPNDATLLFCARGGLRMDRIYQRFLKSAGLQTPVATKMLMVSRVVAVRCALAHGCNSAFEQIGYEMGGSTLAEVVRAMGGKDMALDLVDFNQPYSSQGLAAILAAPAGEPLAASIAAQAALFRKHLESCLNGRGRAILCDTGLSGSTMQLLEDAFPDINWACVLFARANYKKLSTSHFPRTLGLSIETDQYTPFDGRSAILRYWHLIESTLEPALKSVSWFEESGGVVRSNLEIEGWLDMIGPAADEIFAGVLAYLDTLAPGSAAARINADAPGAYAELCRALRFPTRADIDRMDIGFRSLDFGRTDRNSGRACEPGLRMALRGSLWREGAVALAAPRLRLPLLAGIEAAYVIRWALRAKNRPIV
jgi:hypothetical protein